MEHKESLKMAVDTSPFATGYETTGMVDALLTRPKPLKAIAQPEQPKENPVNDMVRALFSSGQPEASIADKPMPGFLSPQDRVNQGFQAMSGYTPAPVKFNGDISNVVNAAAAEYGIDPKMFARIIHIESGGNPNARTGSYLGLGQLGPDELRKYGVSNPYDPVQNARATAAKMADEARAYREKFGVDPTPVQRYMIHQQGAGGTAAHMANPDLPAWKNMASTAEGRSKGDAWAQKAIWGNVPTQFRNQFGNVNNITSRQFMDMWGRKLGL